VRWLFGAKRLNRLGVLGINRRNLELLQEENPRALFPLVDDKLQMAALCHRVGIPTPKIFTVVDRWGQQDDAVELLRELGEFVVKPVRGAAGKGIFVSTGITPSGFARPNGKTFSFEAMRHHLGEILSGMYSLGGNRDGVLIQERLQIHPAFRRLSYRGLPDLRVIVHRGEPRMAMLRLATLESNGRANLHQGGIGVGIDLESGITTHAIQGDQPVEVHPDTGEHLADRPIPEWSGILKLASQAARVVGLGYLGIDVVLDESRGPLLLEANARPGLSIQLATRRGLL
jgi:alpha-L-glutamate ligase-like protein